MGQFVPYPGFCGSAYQQAAPREILSVDQSINVYPHRNEIGTGKAGIGLIQRPGCTLFSSPLSPGNGRALWAGENRLFSVTGSKLNEIASGGGNSTIGDIGAGSGVCTIVSNGLSSGGMLMIINPNTDVLNVVDGGIVVTPTTPAGARIGFQLRGYGFIVAPDTNTLFASNASDFTDWPALAQGTFIAGQDRILAAIEDNGIAWLIGSATSQPVSFTGASPFPLAPIIGGTVSVGTCGPFTPARAGGGVCMVSGSRNGFGQVIRLTSGRFDRISNYAVEQSLATVSDWGSVIGSGYNSQGHDFYVLDIGTLQWVYDFTEKAWHQRRSWSGSAYVPMLGRMHQCTFSNTYYVLAPVSGNVYKLNEAISQDAGTTFRRQRTGPILYANRRTNYNRFRLDQQVTDGLGVTGAAARFSMDGGLIYNAYSTETAGRNGEFGVVEWPQLGQADIRGFVADVVWDTNNLVAVAGASVDVSPGLS